MASTTTSFQVEVREITKGNFLHLIQVEKIDSKLKALIEKHIVDICEGDTGNDIKIVKAQLKTFLKSKKDSTIEMGAIAEFFLHLYLNEMGFKQECLFFNLEEGSIKKGFDGYYSLLNEEWILESKSGSINTANISHPKKVKEAYEDLEQKLIGNVSNNPWNNAFNHARVVNSSTDIKKNLKKLSNEFVKKKPQAIKKFNIIPSSTIFLEGVWKTSDPDELQTLVQKLVKTFKFNKITIICIDKKSLELFKSYLGL